jgi:RNA polymerase sigma-70 factor (ECF subfamily)
MATPLDGPSRCDPQHLLTHLGWLRSLARQLVSDQQVAEDLAQDACIIALEGQPSDPARMRGWLTGTLERLVFKHLRSERRRLEHESEAAQRETLEETEALVEQVEAQGELVRCVLALDEPYRDVILYYHFEDLSWSEIAHRLGVSTTAVKSRLQRAHAQLRKRLERKLGKDPRVWSLLLLGSSFEPGGALLTHTGGLLMGTKLAVAGTVVATATLLTYLALGPSGGDLRAPGSIAAIEMIPGRSHEPEPERASAPEPTDVRAPVEQPVAAAPAPVEETPAQPAAGAHPRDRLLGAMEGALRGDMDIAGFVELGFQIAELAPDAAVRPTPRLGGAVAYPLLDAPDGVAAEFEVARTNNLAYQDPRLSLRLAVEPPAGPPYLVSGSARRQPEVLIAVVADPSGKPLSFTVTADFPLDGARNRELGISTDQGRTPLSIHFSYDLADPARGSKAKLTWLEDGANREGPIDWVFVGARPQEAQFADLLARLQAQHSALYD